MQWIRSLGEAVAEYAGFGWAAAGERRGPEDIKVTLDPGFSQRACRWSNRIILPDTCLYHDTYKDYISGDSDVGTF